MLGQQYVESMVLEVSEWCMRSAVYCVSGVGSMVCMGVYMRSMYMSGRRVCEINVYFTILVTRDNGCGVEG